MGSRNPWKFFLFAKGRDMTKRHNCSIIEKSPHDVRKTTARLTIYGVVDPDLKRIGL